MLNFFMEHLKLFSKYTLGTARLQNRIVMSPMTRSRANGNIPGELTAEYYGQRSSAGLIITEGTSPSPNGLGYSRIPGIFSKAQVEGWKKVTVAAHNGGAKIFLQLMHTGRIGHQLNLPEGARVLAPSAVQAAGQIWTDQSQRQDYPVPFEMTADDIIMTKNEYATAASNAIEAGFDGVELHGANGYLLEQFLSPVSNRRTDSYGGSIEKRSLFVLEVAEAVSTAIGKEKTGIRLSPYGVASDMPHYPEIDLTYSYLAEKLSKINIAYIHLVDRSAMGAPSVPDEIKRVVRKLFRNTLILSGGYNNERAEADLQSGRGDLIAFGRPFINNPDLVDRFRNEWPLSSNLNFDLFYTPGPKGYTDYPVYNGQEK
jgi:NADH:flavin oxidoreductases, Old Yellow Enzyme family